MTSPFTAAWAGLGVVASGKLLLVVVAMAGVFVTLAYLRDVPTSRWYSAAMFAGFAAYFGAPLAGAWAKHSAYSSWLSPDAAEGLCALALGVGALHFVGALMTLLGGLSADPIAFVRRLLGKETGNE